VVRNSFEDGDKNYAFEGKGGAYAEAGELSLDLLHKS
jgi:hypothetical protein